MVRWKLGLRLVHRRARSRLVDGIPAQGGAYPVACGAGGFDRCAIEQAKADAVKDAEECRKKRVAAQTEAEQARRKAIDGAVAKAARQGQTEAEALKAGAANKRATLAQDTEAKIGPAIEKVVSYLRG